MAVLKKLAKEIKKMAKTLAEATAEMADLRAAVTEQVSQTKELIAAVEKVLAAGPGSPDLQPLFDEMEAAKTELTGDNADVQVELDKVNPPTPPIA